MLTHLKLDNFKIWRTTGPIRLAPLTLLLGTNSSGKSSLIQSLLLIRQTVKSTDDNLDLYFGSLDSGDSVALGQFKDVLCRRGLKTETTPANQFGIEFRWNPSGSAEGSSIFSARYRDGKNGSAELDYLRLGKDQEGFIVTRHAKGIYKLFLSAIVKTLGISFSYRPYRSFALSDDALERFGVNKTSMQAIGPTLLDELGRIIYLGPIRRLAQRDYVWTGRMPTHIGDDGAKAIDALIASGVVWQKEMMRWRRVQDEVAQAPLLLSAEAKLFDQAIYWLNKMDLATGLKVKALGNSSRYELLIENEGEFSNLRDVGVGVSQVIPVIVAALFANPGHIVIVEEPESHLHPLAQRQLAELFSHVSAERDIQFIVETHSEHLFRRMQTLMAKGEINNKNCAMYFVEREGTQAKLRPLNVDETGRIKNWPPLFFGDSLGETREQTELAIKRAKALRAADGNVSD